MVRGLAMRPAAAQKNERVERRYMSKKMAVKVWNNIVEVYNNLTDVPENVAGAFQSTSIAVKFVGTCSESDAWGYYQEVVSLAELFFNTCNIPYPEVPIWDFGVYFSHQETAKSLLSKGEMPTESFLWGAVLKDDQQAVAMATEHLPIGRWTRGVREAIKTGRTSVLKIFIEKGYIVPENMIVDNLYGRGNRVDVLKMLGKFLSKNGLEQIFISRAVGDNDEELFEFCLGQGINLNAVDPDGCTALHYGYDGKFLATLYNDVSALTEGECLIGTPIESAAANGKWESMKFMLDSLSCVLPQRVWENILYKTLMIHMRPMNGPTVYGPPADVVEYLLEVGKKMGYRPSSDHLYQYVNKYPDTEVEKVVRMLFEYDLTEDTWKTDLSYEQHHLVRKVMDEMEA